MRRRVDLDQKKDEIIKWYVEDELSTIKIGDLVDAHAGTIERRLNDWNVPLRLSGRPHLDESVFDNLNPGSLYWLGYFAGDGCIRKINQSYRIMLGSKDREHLLKFRNFLQTKQEIKADYNNNWMLRVSSKRIGEKLISYGIVPNKSLVITMDQNVVNSPEFMRGIIDSDGTFGIYPEHNYKLSVHTGSLKFAHQLQEAMTMMCENKYNAKIYKNRNGYNVMICQKQKLEMFMDKLYSDSQFLYRLDRKYHKSRIIRRCLN